MTTTSVEMPESTARELARLKAYFPYRIVWAACRDGVWSVGASKTMRLPNKYTREGWAVFTYESAT